MAARGVLFALGGLMTLLSVLFALLAGPWFLRSPLRRAQPVALRRRRRVATPARQSVVMVRPPVDGTSEPKPSAHREIHFMPPVPEKTLQTGQKCAPVAQWREQRFPKPRAQFRLVPGVSPLTRPTPAAQGGFRRLWGSRRLPACNPKAALGNRWPSSSPTRGGAPARLASSFRCRLAHFLAPRRRQRSSSMVE